MEFPDLRPLSFGELLDRTFTYYRRHFWLFVSIMAVPQALIVTANVVSQGVQAAMMPVAKQGPPTLPGTGYFVALIAGSLITMLLYFVLYSVALGAMTFAVSEVHLGRSCTARVAYRKIRGRLWRLLDLIVTIIVRALLCFSLLWVVLVGSIALTPVLPGAAAILPPILGIFLFLGGAFLFAWYFLRYGCSVPALLLENLKASLALKRSVALTKGNVGRVFLIMLLTSIVSYAIAMVLQGPFLFVFFWKALKNQGQPPPFWVTLGLNVSGGLGHVLVGPLLMIGLVLLYYDLRARKEGFDLQLMIAALGMDATLATASVAAPGAVEPLLEKSSVAQLIAWNLLTLGLYYPLWFLQRRASVNRIASGGKVGRAIFLFVFALWFLAVSGSIAWIGSEGIRARVGPVWVLGFDVAASLISVLLLAFQAFKVRRILETHQVGLGAASPFATSISLLESSSFSGAAILVFGIFYLQYKMNELAEMWAQGPTAIGTNILPAI